MLELKELHMKYQMDLVKEIKIMSEESKKIITDIEIIEGDIEKYQTHVDIWSKKIEEMSDVVGKIKGNKESFLKRAENIGKLRDHLTKELKKK